MSLLARALIKRPLALTSGPEEVDVLKSHADNLLPQADGSGRVGPLLRYVATYNTKFSDSFADEMFGHRRLRLQLRAARALQLPPAGAGDVADPLRQELPAVRAGRHHAAVGRPVAGHGPAARLRGRLRGLPLARRGHDVARVPPQEQRAG